MYRTIFYLKNKDSQGYPNVLGSYSILLHIKERRGEERIREERGEEGRGGEERAERRR